MPEIVILGAGLTGLSTAYHLEKNNFFNFSIYEKESRAGGLMRSEHCNGFTFDYTGHYLHISDQHFHTFIDDIADTKNFDKIQRNSAIYTHNTHVAYPIQMNLCGLPTQTIYECLDGYINRPVSRKKPTNFYDWVLKYFGKGFGDNFFFPYNGKLLAYPVKKIHPSWTGRFVPQTSLHNILKGALEKNPHDQVGYNSCFYYPKHGGIESFIKNLKQKITTPIHLNHEVAAIDQQKKVITFTNGTTTSYDILITTLPLDKTLNMTANSSSSPLKHIAQKLWCNSVINFNLGFSAQNIGPYHWLYFPEKYYHFYRIGFWHNISKSLATPQCSGIYGEISYQPRQHSRAAMQKKVDLALTQTLCYLGLTSNDIQAALTLEIDHGYVAYDAWREKNIARLLATLQNEDIYSIGRFGAWKYSSMQEAYQDGKEAAQLALNHKDTTPKQPIYPIVHPTPMNYYQASKYKTNSQKAKRESAT